MNCPKCGAVNPDGVSFCTACGTPLAADQPVQEQPAQTPSAAEQPPMPPQNNGWQQPPMPQWAQPPVMPTDEPVSVGKWIGILALQAFCGIVYLIMLFVWAFGSTSSESLKNYARAQLIIAAIVLAIVIVLSIIFAAFIPDLVDQIKNYSYYYEYHFSA